ncbi:MAG: hypothetical protein ACTSQS_16055, partial [Promethearchaeota archaeon]
MNEKVAQKKKSETKAERGSINLILLSISLLIFGGLGLIFLTQMELLAGWSFRDYENEYPVQLHIVKAGDLDGDGISEILCYADVEYEGREGEFAHNDPTFGAVLLFDGETGKILWQNEYNNPVKRVFRIKDCNGDKIDDFFICRATVESEWSEDGTSIVKDRQFDNFLLSGDDGKSIISDENSLTNLFVIDLVNLDNYEDNIEDIICLEYNYTTDNVQYYMGLTGYFINGTIAQQNSTFFFNNYFIERDIKVPAIELFPHDSEMELLFIEFNSVRLINIENYSEIIYSTEVPIHISDFIIINDLTSDDIPEIIVASTEGEAILLDGSDLNILQEFNIISAESSIELQEIINNNDDDCTYIVVDAFQIEDEVKTAVYKIELSDNSEIWKRTRKTQSESLTIVLLDDLDGDNINDIILHEQIETAGSFTEVDRFYIVSAVDDNNEIGIINIQDSPVKAIIFDDINGDDVKDIAFASYKKIIVMSAMDPVPIWLFSKFQLGFYLFIIFLIFSCFGILIIIIKRKELDFNFKKSMKENKLTFVITTIALTLVTITFLLFLSQINIFNFTLIAGDQMTKIIIAFLVVIILWYGMLPLTAAIYNKYSPRFAYLFISIRNSFFKITKTNNNEILVVDLGDRQELGTVNKIRRVILPLLLSIAVSFYLYNTLAPILDYPQGFNVFGSEEFFSFIVGYMLLCVLPIILTFTVFSFMIAGNYLLDDAGIIYYVESKKYRKPGDIEPISIWSQSIIKGIAGISALFTFGTFFLTVDLSGFFQQ